MNNIDVGLFQAINGLAGRWPWLDQIGIFFTTIGNGGAVWLLLGLGLLLVAGWRSQLWRRIGLSLLLTLAADGLVNWLLKRLIERPRPYLSVPGVNQLGNLPDPYSFPSGHSSSSFATAVFFLLVVRHHGGPRWAGWLAVAVATLIGLSRIYLGHHYPTDVLAGAAIGASIGALGYRFASRYVERAAQH